MAKATETSWKQMLNVINKKIVDMYSQSNSSGCTMWGVFTKMPELESTFIEEKHVLNKRRLLNFPPRAVARDPRKGFKEPQKSMAIRMIELIPAAALRCQTRCFPRIFPDDCDGAETIRQELLQA